MYSAQFFFLSRALTVYIREGVIPSSQPFYSIPLAVRRSYRIVKGLRIMVQCFGLT